LIDTITLCLESENRKNWFTYWLLLQTYETNKGQECLINFLFLKLLCFFLSFNLYLYHHYYNIWIFHICLKIFPDIFRSWDPRPKTQHLVLTCILDNFVKNLQNWSVLPDWSRIINMLKITNSLDTLLSQIWYHCIFSMYGWLISGKVQKCQKFYVLNFSNIINRTTV